MAAAALTWVEISRHIVGKILKKQTIICISASMTIQHVNISIVNWCSLWLYIYIFWRCLCPSLVLHVIPHISFLCRLWSALASEPEWNCCFSHGILGWSKWSKGIPMIDYDNPQYEGKYNPVTNHQLTRMDWQSDPFSVSRRPILTIHLWVPHYTRWSLEFPMQFSTCWVVKQPAESVLDSWVIPSKHGLELQIRTISHLNLD